MSALIGSPEPIAALNRVKILELSLPWQQRAQLVDVRGYCKDVVIHGGICPYLREAVANMLNRAQEALPAGYHLRAGTCLRTLSMQKGGWDGYFNRMKEEHPGWPLSALRRATNHYFAPYNQKAPPGHCTGGAVDVGLLDPQGNALDMTAPTKGWEAAYTWSHKISPESRKNRMLMVEAMLQAGFSNCRDEFWHYSWGDSAWAVRTGQTECPFGWSHPPVALETDFNGARAQEQEIVTVRDLEGKPTRSNGSIMCTPHKTGEAGIFSIGLYWAKDVETVLTIRLPSGDSFPNTLYSGDGKKRWNPIEGWEVVRSNLIVHITPNADRVIITDVLPESLEPES